MTRALSKTIIAVVGMGAVVFVVWTLFYRPTNSCDSVFEQVSTSFGSRLEFIQAKGEVLIGKQKVQDLTERAQLTALNLKTCCIVLEGGKLNASEFLSCKRNVEQQEAHVDRVMSILREAATAQEKSQPDVVRQKVGEAEQAIQKVNEDAANLDRQVAGFKAGGSPSTGAAPAKGAASVEVEHEPNNSAFEANNVKLGDTISGSIAGSGDVDWFAFHADNKVRDMARIRLINRSTTLAPEFNIYDADKNRIYQAYAGTAGANLEGTLAIVPGQDYFVAVKSESAAGSGGAYDLALKLLNAYDAYEPNDDQFSARGILPDQAIVASVMDGKDDDWYVVKGFPTAKMAVRLDNDSTTLDPYLAVYDMDKNRVGYTQGMAGANAVITGAASAGKDYYFEVRSASGGKAGKYRLTVKSNE